MRKLLAVVLSLTMIFSMAACGKKDEEKNPAENNTVTSTPAPEAEDKDNGVITPEFAAGTAGEKLWNEFLETMKANPETSAIDMANKLIANPLVQFMGGAAEVEPGFLNGFEGELAGFEKSLSDAENASGMFVYSGILLQLLRSTML